MRGGIFQSGTVSLTIPTESSVRASRTRDGEPWRFRVHGEAAGGYRPHCRRLHQAEEGWGAELFGAVSLSWGEDGVVFGARHTAVLSLLWLWRLGGRVQ